MTSKFNNERYVSIKELGKGGQGKVFLVRDTRDDVKKAMKQIYDCELEIRKEAKILQEVNSSCPYIVKYFDSFEEAQFFNIVFEYHKFGDLDDLIEDQINKKSTCIPSNKVKIWSKQLLEALDFIHIRNIIHRDVKPKNILLNNFGDVILADFGVAVHPETIKNSVKGTFNYMSPEIIDGKKYGLAIDLWSFGCVVHELFTLKKAFSGNIADVTRKILAFEIEFPSFENEPEIEFMIKNTIKIVPSERLTARVLLEKLDIYKSAERHFKQGEFLLESVDYTDARKCFEKSLEIKEDFKVDNKVDIANTLNKIGECYMQTLDFDNALLYMNKSYEIHKQFTANKNGEITDNIHLFNSLMSLGDCYLSNNNNNGKNNLTKAFEYFTKAHEMIKRMRKAKPDEKELHVRELAKSAGKLGRCLFLSDEFEKSLEYNLNSLEIYRQLYTDQDNRDVAQALNHVGNSYSWYGNNQSKGLQFNIEAFDMRKRLFGEKNHIDVAKSLFDLGNSYWNLKETEKALKYYLDSLEMYERLFKFQDHPMIASCLKNVAGSYNAVKQLDKSLDYYFRSLQMKKRLLKNNVDDQDVVNTLNNIARIYNKLNDQENYSKYKQLAIDAQKRLA